MAGIIGHRAGLHIARQVGFNADAALAQKIHHGGILRGPDGMTDARGPEFFHRGDNALGAGGLARVDRDIPTGIAALLEMLDEKFGRPIAFVARQVQGHDFFFVVEQGAQFAPRPHRPVGARENADQVRFHSRRLLALAHALDHSCRDLRGIQIVGIGHEQWAEAQFEIAQPLSFRVFHIFARHAAACVVIGEHTGHPAELGEKFDQPRLGRGDDDVRTKLFQCLAGKRNAVLATEVENCLEAHTAVQMAVQVDEGRTVGHEQSEFAFTPHPTSANRSARHGSERGGKIAERVAVAAAQRNGGNHP